MGIYSVEIKETYKCVADVTADSEESALKIVEALYDSGAIEIESEDISETEYKIIK